MMRDVVVRGERILPADSPSIASSSELSGSRVASI
jgi:hypothetical protein